MIVYFTGTGNSRYCAKMLADQLEDDLLDTFPFLRDGIAPELTSRKPWVFVAPTYSWQLPRIFADLIRSGRFSGSQDAYFVMTCGDDIGAAAQGNRELCQEKGFHYRGTLPVVMPENYIAMFQAPQPEEAKQIIAAARPTLERALTLLREGREFPPVKAGVLDGLKSGLVNRLFYRFQVKATPFTVSDKCISCGKCEAVCPMGNVRMEAGRPVWGNRCTHCMACICGCPAEAIEYGRSSQGKPRYQCPEYGKTL